MYRKSLIKAQKVVLSSKDLSPWSQSPITLISLSLFFYLRVMNVMINFSLEMIYLTEVYYHSQQNLWNPDRTDIYEILHYHSFFSTEYSQLPIFRPLEQSELQLPKKALTLLAVPLALQLILKMQNSISKAILLFWVSKLRKMVLLNKVSLWAKILVQRTSDF